MDNSEVVNKKHNIHTYITYIVLFIYLCYASGRIIKHTLYPTRYSNVSIVQCSEPIQETLLPKNIFLYIGTTVLLLIYIIQNVKIEDLHKIPLLVFIGESLSFLIYLFYIVGYLFWSSIYEMFT